MRNDRLYTPAYHARRYKHPEPELERELDLNLSLQFKRMHIRVPKHTSRELRNDEILIIPSILTHLKISVYSNDDKDVIRAAMAGDMRMRDVLKQILPQECLPDAKSYVRRRGEWTEPGGSILISQVVELGRFAMDESGEVEVRVVVGDGRKQERERERAKERERQRERGMGRYGGWEREIGRTERMRVY